MDTPDLDPLARAIFRAEERVRAARAQFDNAQSSLESANAEAANAGRELDQRMTDLEGEMLTLDALRNGQAVPAEARALPAPRRYTGGPLEDGLYLWRRPGWHRTKFASMAVREGILAPYDKPCLHPGDWVWLIGPIHVPDIPSEATP